MRFPSDNGRYGWNLPQTAANVAVQIAISTSGADFMPKENGSLRATPVARAHGGLPPRLEEDDGLQVAPVTASVTQLKGMAPKPELPVSLEAMDKAIARAVAERSE